MKCDLHVHTVHSGMCTLPWLRHICRECYNDPAEVYEILKRRGMDLVTVTDHDSIDAAETLRRHPDFFLSEEVTCHTPRGTEFHAGVYGITERDHIELQRRRDDLASFAAYLDERGLVASINHVFSGLTGARHEADYDDFARVFEAVETRNGQMLESANRSADAYASRLRKTSIGGSDSHTLASLGRTYTHVSGARDRGEFIEGLRRGHSSAHGDSGGFLRLTRAICDVSVEMMRERRWTAVFSPILAAAPLAAAINMAAESAFASKWGRLAAGTPAPEASRGVLERV